MKNNKLTIMEKLVKENDRLQVEINTLYDSIHTDQIGDPLDTLQIIKELFARKNKVCKRWLKLAYEVAPPRVRIAKTIKDLEAVWE